VPTKTHSYDVVILGGGPAGAATALSLRQHAPSLSVALIDQSARRGLGKGESLPPTVQPVLEQLGIWDAFEKDDHLPSYGTCALWGSDELIENEFIFNPAGRGWHLDRPCFDAMLASESAARGVSVYSHSEFKGAHLTKQESWALSVKTSDENEVSFEAGFVVDASGRRAAFATRQQVRKVLLDRLVGLFVFFDFDAGSDLIDTYTLVEAGENGWWYSALLPDNRLAVAFMTDADIVNQSGLKNSSEWFELLNKTRQVKNRVQNARPLTSPVVHAASSRRLEKMTGTSWLAVGDAASTFDPLSSQGIVKGLRSGVIAAYAICDYFKGSASSLGKYETLIAKEFEEYLSARTEYYRQERRWEDSLFWRRRYDYITLDPNLVLRSTPDADSSPVVEKLSMHLPVIDLLYLCNLCRTPRAAREVVARFNAERRFPDRRVILALQYLVEEGVITQPSS
jgi:flavin-dependent dehydrogenase